jgi:hypothetical protein
MSSIAATRSTALTGLHLLLTYECNYECDHCFVWGSPSLSGTMSIETIANILQQAEALGTIEWIYFEGGEPSLYYELLCSGARLAREHGFKVGIVSNASWATNEADALKWLQPFIGIVEDLSISDDAYHNDDDGPQQTHIARQAAEHLDIPVDFNSVSGVEAEGIQNATLQSGDDESAVLYRGRAADKLALHAQPKPWDQFTECPWEELRFPDRVHVDPFGNLHICQGISIGNLLKTPLIEIMGDYSPETHPITGPLLAGGPVELVNRYGLKHEDAYADACHLCYLSRCKLRDRFPNALTPDQMYGVR